jgi:hypothetical protein
MGSEIPHLRSLRIRYVLCVRDDDLDWAASSHSPDEKGAIMDLASAYQLGFFIAPY